MADSQASSETEDISADADGLSTMTFDRKRKARLIRRVLKRADMSEGGASSELRQLTLSRGGLLDDAYRRRVWPLLARHLLLDDDDDGGRSSAAGADAADRKRADSESSDYESAVDSIDSDSEPSTPTADAAEQLEEHAEWRQVEMDVQRTLARFPPHIDDPERAHLQAQLTPIIVRILHKNQTFRYYQGFHDVCLTLLLVLGAPAAAEACAAVAERGVFRDLLQRPLEEAALARLRLMYVIVWRTDGELERRLRRSDVGTLFALSWLLTWFSHSFNSPAVVNRLFDLFLAAHPLMPVYVGAAVVLFRSAEVLDLGAADMPLIHSLLSQPPAALPLEALIADAQDLFVQFPPTELRGHLLDEYEAFVRVDAMRDGGGRVALRRRQRRNSWTAVPRPDQAIKFTVWAVTASAAVWYFYRNYGQLSWMNLL